MVCIKDLNYLSLFYETVFFFNQSFLFKTKVLMLQTLYTLAPKIQLNYFYNSFCFLKNCNFSYIIKSERWSISTIWFVKKNEILFYAGFVFSIEKIK